MGCTMETSQNIRKGMRSGRSAKPEPQSDWDSFFLTTGIPKDPKGDFPLPAEMMISHCTKAGVEEVSQEGRTLEALSSQQQIPWRRGRPRKNKETEEIQVPNEPRTRSAIEELLMRAIQLEPVEGTSREIWSRTRRIGTVGTNVRETSQ
jgi:hypothetical protein